uniref:Variant surface glycoprotein 1125.1006 n=1 Tax=Trypanosoma brucei TaxID=5691 RepID=A0A1J0R647_9TRYP|nr:variant surface glycoprotein 1125.1006 [Trypanosoma brucei]
MAMQIGFFLAIIVLTTGVQAASENQAEFGQLCHLYQLMTEPIAPITLTQGAGEGTKTSPLAAVQNIMARAQKLNISVAEDGINTVLADKAKYKNKAAIDGDKAVKGYFTDKTDDDITRLRAEYEEITTASGDSAAFRKKYGTPLNKQQRDALRAPISTLYVQLIGVRDEIKHRTELAYTLITSARVTLAKAVYGDAAVAPIKDQIKPESPLPAITAANFPWHNTGDRNAVCKTAGTDANKAGMALATDMLCICLKHQANTHDACSTSFAPTQAAYNTGRTPAEAQAAFTALTAKCQNSQQTYSIQELPHLLTSAVAAIKASMGTNHVTAAAANTAANTPGKKAFFYGRFFLEGSAPACDANHASPNETAAKGICIDYSGLMKPGSDIPWLKLVHSGINQLQTAEKEESAVISLVGVAEGLETQMESLLLMKSLLTLTAETLLTATSNQPSVEKQNKCAKFDKNETDCTNNNCDYDNTTKECKSKAGTENTAGAKAATTGCAVHKDEAACHNYKTKNKQNLRGGREKMVKMKGRPINSKVEVFS